ncbi:MAG: hypothetical protein ACLUHE_08950 [Christensenellales bacterium]
MSMKHYLAARKEGLKQQHAAQARGQDPYLPVLSRACAHPQQADAGAARAGADRAGSNRGHGDEGAHDGGFRAASCRCSSRIPSSPPSGACSTTALWRTACASPSSRWNTITAFTSSEGNKRVSVMRRLDAVSIEADVTRVLPEPEDSERYRVYQEFLSFYADTKINFITFTREGSYEKLYKLMGKTPGKKWTPEDLFDFQSCFYRFQQAYSAKAEGSAPMPACDALLILSGGFRLRGQRGENAR